MLELFSLLLKVLMLVGWRGTRSRGAASTPWGVRRQQGNASPDLIVQYHRRFFCRVYGGDEPDSSPSLVGARRPKRMPLGRLERAISNFICIWVGSPIGVD